MSTLAAAFAFAVMLLGAGACAIWPTWVAPYFVFLLYARIPDSLRGEYGIPSFFMFLAPALIGLAIYRVVFRRERIGRGWKTALWWMCAWGAVGLASLLYAFDTTRTIEALLDYADALLIVLIVTLFLNRREQIAQVSWALIGAGTFLGLLTLHQKVTGDFASTYAGFAHVEMRGILEDTEGFRSAGPVSANYFALILVPLVPLALDRLLRDPSRRLRAAAFAALIVIVGAIACTYSRGGFLTLGFVTLLTLLTMPRWPRVLLAFAPVAALLLIAMPQDYAARMSTFGQVWDGLLGRHVEDGAIRGRLSELRSAAQMFSDHPWVGVGTGNFETHYTQYASEIALDARREERQAHSLYLEVAAENGVLGLVVFGGLLAYALLGIQRAREGFRCEGEADLVHRTTAFGIGFAGYLLGSLFLHLSYPRFFWVWVGLAFAVRAVAPAPAPARATQREQIEPGEQAWA